MPTLQGDGQFSAPRNRNQESGNAQVAIEDRGWRIEDRRSLRYRAILNSRFSILKGLLLGLNEFREVVQQAAKAGSIAPCFLIQTGAAAVEKTNGITRLTKTLARVLVPPSMTLNPVHTKDAGFHRFRRQVATIPPTIAVAGRVFFDRPSRLSFRHSSLS